MMRTWRFNIKHSTHSLRSSFECPLETLSIDQTLLGTFMQTLAPSSGKHALLHVRLDRANILLPGTKGVALSKVDGSFLIPQYTLG